MTLQFHDFTIYDFMMKTDLKAYVNMLNLYLVSLYL